MHDLKLSHLRGDSEIWGPGMILSPPTSGATPKNYIWTRLSLYTQGASGRRRSLAANALPPPGRPGGGRAPCDNTFGRWEGHFRGHTFLSLPWIGALQGALPPPGRPRGGRASCAAATCSPTYLLEVWNYIFLCPSFAGQSGQDWEFSAVRAMDDYKLSKPEGFANQLSVIFVYLVFCGFILHMGCVGVVGGVLSVCARFEKHASVWLTDWSTDRLNGPHSHGVLERESEPSPLQPQAKIQGNSAEIPGNLRKKTGFLLRKAQNCGTRAQAQNCGTRAQGLIRLQANLVGMTRN